jgi:subtilisin family serine protease
MVRVRYGGKTGQSYELSVSDEHVAVRTYSRKPLMGDRPYEVALVAPETRMILSDFKRVGEFREAGVEVLRVKMPQTDGVLRDAARSVLKAEPEVRFAGRVLVTEAQIPVLYTENLFIKFDEGVESDVQQGILQHHNLTVKQSIEYAPNAYFVRAPEGTGLAVFDLAESLLQEDAVELCHPELVMETRHRQAFPPQWHLKPTTVNGTAINASANVEAAWSFSKGQDITIAVIDTGIDLEHEEFRASGKIVAPRDATRGNNDPRPRGQENHGTSCAGVACGDGNFGASGVAPNAKLMPIRLASALGSQAEADAFYWAARNGADVISCSWGPPDGEWWNPNDPVHNQIVPLPDSTRLAIDYAVTQGRNGKGCVICWAAGNGNESVDNDGYASYDKVIAIAACNDTSKRSAYSDFGNTIWCAFPSNDGVASLTPGIWTTDRSGVAGYNPGNASEGDRTGNYTNSFGGTSSACPGAAGVAALILSRNPDLRWDQVREVMKQSCDRIDEAGGQYNSEGRSPLYGYGRLNARKAVELAVPEQPTPLRMYRAVQDVPIKDWQTATLAMMVPVTNPLKSIKVSVEIEHTYIGDLVVLLKPPAETGVLSVALHSRTGGSRDNLKITYDVANAPGLASLQGKSPKGNWVLEVSDQAGGDTGRIRSFTLEMGF